MFWMIRYLGYIDILLLRFVFTILVLRISSTLFHFSFAFCYDRLVLAFTTSGLEMTVYFHFTSWTTVLSHVDDVSV